LGLCVSAFLCGCQQAGPSGSLNSIPTPNAARIVNANAAKITGTLRASGSVVGYYTTPQGRRRNYQAEGTLFYLAPHYFRFDLKSLGERQVLLGSNADSFWFFSKQDDSYYCANQGSGDDLPTEVPVRPDQVIDALALAPIGDIDSVSLNPNNQGRFRLEKEYWTDGGTPEVIRRVVFRDRAGTVRMQSELDKYVPLSPDGPLLPRSMTAHWPSARAQMRFRVDKWTLVEQVRPGGPQFATPPECITNERAGRPTGK